jgi:sugar lactone lactonase YvrE
LFIIFKSNLFLSIPFENNELKVFLLSIFYFLFLERISSSPISINTKWKQNGVTIGGGNGRGNQLNQLSEPDGIYVDDDDQCILIADYNNHRIVEWKSDAKMGQVVAGGNGEGNRTDQLNKPLDVIVDQKTDSLIICDVRNRRVVRWSHRNGTNGQVIISDIDCWGLTMDNNGDLYVSDWKNNEVRRWKIGERNGTIVAGGNGQGNQLNQLNNPTYLFVDEDHSVYVSDNYNHRVMKWLKGAKEGMVVAGGQGDGNNSTQLSYPQGVIVDHEGSVYVADTGNYRIMCWSKGSKKGRVIVGGNEEGPQSNQLKYPRGISFDRQGHLYVVDERNHQVQKFEIDLN